MPSRPPSESNLSHTAVVAWMHDFAPYGVITTDRSFTIQSWNRWMEIHSGRVASNAVGRNLFDLFPDLPGRGLRGYFERALQGEISVLSTALHNYLLPLPSSVNDRDFPFMRQSGRVAPLRTDNEVSGTIIVVEDVTQRELQALTLRRQHDRDQVLSWALGQLLKSGDFRRTLRELFYKIAEHADFDTYFLYLLTPDQNTLTLQALGGIPPEVEAELRLLPAASALGSALHCSSSPLVLEHLDVSDPPDELLRKRLNLSVCAVLPLVAEEKPFGTLCYGSCTRPALEQGELELLSTIAQYVAIAVHKESIAAELKSAQAQLNQHAHQLEKQVSERTARLQEIIAEMEVFSNTVAHDLRAPIRALSGYCEVLLEDYAAVIPEEPRTIIGRLSGACRRLDALTRDLLLFNKVSTQEIQLSPTSVEDLVTEVIGFFPDGQQTFVIVSRPLPNVLAHPALLRQCFANLIDNALKFVTPGIQPRVRISAQEVSTLTPQEMRPHFPLHPSGHATNPATMPGHDANPRPWIQIFIDDNGIGVTAESGRRIFGIFERGASSTGYQGTGIGLAIVARAMQRMGGHCGVAEGADGGSRFWLALKGQ